MAEISFGEWLKRQRKVRGLTQEQLSQQIGCSTIALRKIEAQERRPSEQISNRIANIFSIPQDQQENFVRFARGNWDAFSAIVQTDSWQGPRGAPSSLPASLTSFIGREKEVAELCEYLRKEDTRLVTLIGPPGIGKTRLSIEAARTMLSDFADGIFFVALAPIEDPALATAAIVEGLGYVEARDPQPLKHLTRGIGERCILLILDNCEQVIDAVAALVSELLSSCPRLKILTTSRESLRVQGEWLYSLPPLDAPPDDSQLAIETAHQFPALVLFEERARAVRSDFSLTDENFQAVALICARLDGLPLAIELIATRIRLMSPQALLERMTDSFVLSADGMRSVPARQKTLSNAIRWSYNVLSPEEKKLYESLSVFTGGFLLETAEVVFSEMFPTGSVTGMVMSLFDKSLLNRTVEANGHIRFTMLVTIQQFALEQLRLADAEENARKRHIQYFLGFSEQAGRELIGPQQMEWRARTLEERDNLRAALGWAARNDIEAGMYLASNLGIRFWESFNMYEGVLWLNELLQKPQARSYPRACARALCIQAYLQFHFQQFDLEYEAAGEALELSRAVGDPQSECDSLNQLGSVLLVLDGMVQKVRFQEQALALARSIGDVWRQAEALSGLGWDKRDTKKSLAYREASIALYRQMGDWYGLAFQLSLLAHDAALDGDIEYAQKILNEHSMLRQYTNDKRDAEFVLTAKARIALQQGDYETARFHLQKNISNLQELGNRMGYLWARARLGYVSLREGDFQAAHNILVECIQEFQKDRNQMGLIFPLELMATLLIHEDKPEHAARLIGWTEATRISTGNPISELDASDRRNNLDTLLSTLGENTFKVIYAEGSTMTLEQIVSYALEGYDHLPSL